MSDGLTCWSALSDDTNKCVSTPMAYKSRGYGARVMSNPPPVTSTVDTAKMSGEEERKEPLITTESAPPRSMAGGVPRRHTSTPLE